MKNVLITGGSRGIGAECVRAFSKRGYRVTFIYINNDAAAKALSSETGAAAVRCDVSSMYDMKNAAELISSAGNIDILVNNAGISQIKLFQDISEQDWDKMFDVNIKSMYIATKLFVDGMISRKYGRIINISSMWGETGGSCEVHYSASKAAVIGFTKALAKELGPSGITVNCVSPGVIDTDMNKSVDPQELESLVDEIPACRIGKPADIAETVCFLASEAAGYITGAVIPVNGGFVI